MKMKIEAALLGTINEAVEFIVKGQKDGKCAILPVRLLDEWHNMDSFVSDERDSEQEDFASSRLTHVINKICFNDNGHEYALEYTEMPHLNPDIEEKTVLVLAVYMDDEVLSRSPLSRDEYKQRLFDLAEVEG